MATTEPLPPLPLPLLVGPLGSAVLSLVESEGRPSSSSASLSAPSASGLPLPEAALLTLLRASASCVSKASLLRAS